MTRTLFEIWILILGAVLGFFISILNESRHHTQVKVTKIGDDIIDWNFRSNGTKDGNTFVITVDSDTVLSGVVVDGVWK